MSTTDFLLQWVLPLLIYSGAVVPLSMAVILRKNSGERHRRHRRLLIILLCVQVVSFLPFIVALLFRVPHAIHGLIWPALIGAILFLWGLIYLASECVQFLRLKYGAPLGESGAAPNGDSGVTEGPPSVR